MKGRILYGALGVVFLLNTVLIWNAVNQETTFPEYLFKSPNNSLDLVEQEAVVDDAPQPKAIEKKVLEPIIEESVKPDPKANNVTLANGNIEIVIESGQTLGSLARKYHVSIDQIKEANGLTSDVLQLGQTIVIPAAGSNAVTEKPKTEPNGIHEVQVGETLNKIARKYNIEVDKLKAANSLEDDKINVGQKLKIPN
jgi:LysM repeat protein